MGDGESGYNLGPSVRLNVHLAAELNDALPHPTKADADRSGSREPFFRGDAFAAILDFEADLGS